MAVRGDGVQRSPTFFVGAETCLADYCRLAHAVSTNNWCRVNGLMLGHVMHHFLCDELLCLRRSRNEI